MFGQSLDLRRKKKTDVNLHRDLRVTVTIIDPSTTECPLQTEHRATTLSSDLSFKGFSRGQRPVNHPSVFLFFMLQSRGIIKTAEGGEPPDGTGETNMLLW